MPRIDQSFGPDAESFVEQLDSKNRAVLLPRLCFWKQIPDSNILGCYRSVTWLTFAISPAAPGAEAKPTGHVLTK
jgi:hypothetical protein